MRPDRPDGRATSTRDRSVAPRGRQMEQYSREDIAEIKSRIGQIQEMLSVRSEERPVSAEGDPQTMLVEQVSFSLQTRRIRQDHFGRAQLSGANWDMMLDLMLAREQEDRKSTRLNSSHSCES